MRSASLLLSLVIATFFVSCSPKETDKMPVIKRDNTEINYNIYGDGGATLLFVHGSYIDQTYWKAQVDYFQNDYTVVTMDLPGHGKSGKNRENWTVQGFAEDVYQMIKKAKLKNVILIGHSLGGDINLIAATSHPKNIIGFIGIDNFKDAATKPPKGSEKRAAEIQAQLRKDFATTNEFYARKMLMTQETDSVLAARIVNDFRNAYQPMAIQMMPEFFELYKTEQRLLPRLEHKLHLINVDYFPTDEKPLKKYAGKGYDIQYMKGTSHYPMVENPDEFNRLLRKSIESIARENEMEKIQ